MILEPVIKGELNLRIVELLENKYPEFQVNVNMINKESLANQKEENSSSSG